MAINYVRFQRGTKAAYSALVQSDRIDENTLYFIYPDTNSSTGELYLGNRLISGGEATVVSSTLADLQDVIISETGAGSFLVQNDKGKWESKSLEDVVSLITKNMGEIVPPAQVFQTDLNEDESDLEAIARIVGKNTVAAGDIAIIKALIAEGKYQHTAYVFDGDSWAAMDGNYNAETVYFDSNLTITANVGVQTVGSSGSLELNTTGKNLKQVLDMLLAKRNLPNVTQPSVTVSSSQIKAYEVGTTVTPSYTTTFNPGNYSYGPNTDITPTSWSVSFNGESLATASGTFSPMIVNDDTNAKITATATYPQGAIPNDNLGNPLEDAQELADKRISAGTASKSTSAITGYRNAFYGSFAEAIVPTSVTLRALEHSVATSNSFKMSIVEGARQVVIAVPKGRKVTKVEDTAAFGTDIFSKFSVSTVEVGGYDATAENIGTHTKDYNVYVYAPSAALGANSYTVSLANE